MCSECWRKEGSEVVWCILKKVKEMRYFELSEFDALCFVAIYVIGKSWFLYTSHLCSALDSALLD